MREKIHDTICSVVSLYGFNCGPGVLSEASSVALEWFRSLEVTPEKMGFGGNDVSVGVASYGRRMKKLEQMGFQGVQDISVFSLHEGGSIPLADWKVCWEMDCRYGGCATIGAWVGVARLEDERSVECTEALVRLLRPTYGIGFYRELRFGPTLYAAGLAQNLPTYGETKAENHRINEWGRSGRGSRVYDRGVLRDVYPLNLLNGAQLDRKVGKKRLETWIQSSGEHGVLSEMAGMALWKVEESSIPSIRETLSKSGLIYDPDRR